MNGRMRLFKGTNGRIGLYKEMDEMTVNELIFTCYFCYYYGHCNCIYI